MKTEVEKGFVVKSISTRMSRS